MKIDRERDYSAFMRTAAEPVLDAARETFRLAGARGVELYCERYAAPDARGAVVMLHGFSGSAAKYRELMYDFLTSGLTLYAFDLRGHGRSGREVADPRLIHVYDYTDYVQDLCIFYDKAAAPGSSGLPLYMYAHSLGGAIGALFLEERPDAFRRAALSSPMIAPHTSPLSAAAAARAAGRLARICAETSAVPGASADPAYAHFAGSPATSEPRWAYYAALRKGDTRLQAARPTFGWVREAARIPAALLADGACERISTPLLLCRAGRDTLVSRAAQDEFARRAQNCRVLDFPDCRHEIYLSPDAVYAQYMQAVLDFLDTNSE